MLNEIPPCKIGGIFAPIKKRVRRRNEKERSMSKDDYHVIVYKIQESVSKNAWGKCGAEKMGK